MLLVTTLMASLLPKATATPVRIDDLVPTGGPIGTTVRVIGEIDTPNGSYRILFDGKEVGSGNATEMAVNTTFTVPLSAKGNHSVTLFDVTSATQSSPITFNVTTSYYVTAEPARIQEGLNTTITVSVNGAEANTTYPLTINVTDPVSAVYTTTLDVSTDATGSGSNSTLYYGNFPAGANTNYVGTYTITVIGVNETLTTGNFTVGLTNATEYYRFQVVGIRATGYQANESIWINITFAETGETVFSENRSATNGVVETSWEIPWNASTGLYSVTVTNSTTPGTIKPVPDTQNFTVIKKIVSISIVDPTNGPWGTDVTVVGEIVKPGGSYEIRWDNQTIKTGNSNSGSVVVNDTFTVPLSVKGYHNITLRDVNQTTESMPATFEVTTSCYVFAEPARIVEGVPTSITVGVDDAKENTSYVLAVNVTDPVSAGYIATLTISTNATGSGSSSTVYYDDFSSGAHTNYVGKYTVAVIGFDETLATGSFTVGLTDELEYRTTNEVVIRGSGYQSGEIVTASITYVGTGETVFSENRSATNEGVVSYIWTIPRNATLGNYTVTLANATITGTFKPIPDVQNFTVIEIIVRVQARNKYDNKSLAGVTIEAYIGKTLIATRTTNETGWVNFRIDRGNYIFNASWRNEIVGTLSEEVTGNATEYVLQKTFYIGCELARIKIAVVDEADPPQPLPFINVTVTSDKTGTLVFVTDYTGVIATNAFTNISYTIEARRYGYLFNRTLIENLTVTRWINITCPTYTMFVHVLDSNGLPLQNVQVSIYEWTSERATGPKATDASGSVSLSRTFGRYKIRVYNYSAELNHIIVLNETVIDLTEDQKFVVIHCKISNIDLSVVVVDYFGQPIPNAVVKLEREFEQGYVSVPDLKTGSDGTALLPKIGGNYRISVYVLGKPFETRTLHLDESKVIVFKIDRLVVVGGYPFETTQLITGISLGTLVMLFALALIYRRLRPRKVQEGEEKKSL
jgi:hypothetical protein